MKMKLLPSTYQELLAKIVLPKIMQNFNTDISVINEKFFLN